MKHAQYKAEWNLLINLNAPKEEFDALYRRKEISRLEYKKQYERDYYQRNKKQKEMI